MAAAGDAMPLLQVGSNDEIGIWNLAALKRAIFKLEILTFAVYLLDHLRGNVFYRSCTVLYVYFLRIILPTNLLTLALYDRFHGKCPTLQKS